MLGLGAKLNSERSLEEKRKIGGVSSETKTTGPCGSFQTAERLVLFEGGSFAFSPSSKVCKVCMEELAKASSRDEAEFPSISERFSTGYSLPSLSRPRSPS